MRKPRRGKRTIGSDPFAALMPTASPAERSPPPPRPEATPRELPTLPVVANEVDPPPAAAATRLPEPDAPAKRQKLTVHLDGEVVNRVKNAAYWNPRLTIARIAERGIRLALKEVEKENGGPYPQRESELKGGRPIGS